MTLAPPRAPHEMPMGIPRGLRVRGLLPSHSQFETVRPLPQSDVRVGSIKSACAASPDTPFDFYNTTAAARSVLVNMPDLTTCVDAEAGKYHIDSSLWAKLARGKNLQLMTAAADARLCWEGKARQLQFIDSLTGALVAEASPTRGIRLFE